jgi:hypothetical protein
MTHSPELSDLDFRIWMLETNGRRRTRTLDFTGYPKGYGASPTRAIELREQKRLRLEAMTKQLVETKAKRQELIAQDATA